MTKLVSAIYEHGQLKPTQPLRLPEHQQVMIAVAINEDDIPSLYISKLAEGSESFKFLNNPEENIYTPSDGEEV